LVLGWAALLGGCNLSSSVTVVPSLPSCLGGAMANALTVEAEGDFPPSSSSIVGLAPDGHASLRLPDGTRALLVEGRSAGALLAFGRTGALDLAHNVGVATDGGIPVAYGPPDAFCAGSQMRLPRAGHTATLLTGGSVLIAGGVDDEGFAVTQPELYLPIGDLNDAPASFRLVDPGGASALDPSAALGVAAAQLGDGALVSGGAPSANGVADGIAYGGYTVHGSDGRVSAGARVLPHGARAFHSATTLADGRVFVAGGCAQLVSGTCAAGQSLDTTMVYDPVAARFSDGPALRRARFGHTAVLRGDGTVLLAGGTGEGGGELPLEIVDPDELRGMDVGAGGAAAAALPSGGVLVVAAATVPSQLASVWPGSGAVEPIDVMPAPRRAPVATALDDGSVLISGGVDSAGQPAATALRYDGRGHLVRSDLPFGRASHAATRLLDGSVLITGGLDGTGHVVPGSVVYLRSPLGPAFNLPEMVLNGSGASDVGDPLTPARPTALDYSSGQAVVTPSQPSSDGAPDEVVLVAGPQLAGLDLTVSLGRSGAGQAALIAGWLDEAHFIFVNLAVGQPVTLYAVTSPRTGQRQVQAVGGCTGVTLDGDELPDGSTASFHLAARVGLITVESAKRPLLSCLAPQPDRGLVGFGASRGPIIGASLTVSR
jgi:hypothetical protein